MTKEMIKQILRFAPAEYRLDEDVLRYVRALETVADFAKYYLEGPENDSFNYHLLTVSLDHLFGVQSA